MILIVRLHNGLKETGSGYPGHLGHVYSTLLFSYFADYAMNGKTTKGG